MQNTDYLYPDYDIVSGTVEMLPNDKALYGPITKPYSQSARRSLGWSKGVYQDFNSRITRTLFCLRSYSADTVPRGPHTDMAIWENYPWSANYGVGETDPYYIPPQIDELVLQEEWTNFGDLDGYHAQPLPSHLRTQQSGSEFVRYEMVILPPGSYDAALHYCYYWRVYMTWSAKKYVPIPWVDITPQLFTIATGGLLLMGGMMAAGMMQAAQPDNAGGGSGTSRPKEENNGTSTT